MGTAASTRSGITRGNGNRYVGGLLLMTALASGCNTEAGKTTAESEPTASTVATVAAIRPLAVVPTKAAPVATRPVVAPTKAAVRTLVTRPSPTSSPKPRPRATVAPVRTTAPKPPAPAATSYANCTEMHKDYPGGVALPGAVDKRASGHAKHTPVYSKPLYDANRGSDRDGDGIACEA